MKSNIAALHHTISNILIHVFTSSIQMALKPLILTLPSKLTLVIILSILFQPTYSQTEQGNVSPLPLPALQRENPLSFAHPLFVSFLQ
jgi:hypothetical protein